MEAGRLEIELRGGSLTCDILIREGLLADVASSLKRFYPSKEEKISSIAIVSDSNTSKIFGTKLKRQLITSGFDAHLFSFRAGEKSKNLRTVENLASEMDAKRIDRNSVLLALGGGVVGDVSGFLASIYKRGIPYFQIPTTLLAQVDSGIGGKTGVDSTFGKNQLGTFYQPKGVLIDPNTLDTLPKKELINGLAEIVKSSIIADSEMFEDLQEINLYDVSEIKKFIYRTCAIKSRVVSQDEKEKNLRSILNYGHTVGHAIEASSNYELNHGSCVALGMISEGWISLQLGFLKQREYDSQLELLQRMLDGSGLKRDSIERILRNKNTLLRLAYSDKKSTSGKIRMSLPKSTGRMASENGDYRIRVTQNLFVNSIEHLLSVLDRL